MIDSGFLLIDKPAGISSFDVIRQLRRQTGIRTFGHAGTLDPFATGLLLIAVNKYTRLLYLLDDADKTYEATLVLGQSSSTGDPEGEIQSSSETTIDPAKLSGLKQAVLHIRKMKPPVYSAIKVDGRRSYARARKNETFVLPERDAGILDFDVKEFIYPRLEYSCRVTKGTYIRSLSEWIAAWLGTTGYTSELKRTAIGSIRLTNAVTPELINAETISAQLVSVFDILPELEKTTVPEADLTELHMGRKIHYPGTDNTQILIADEQSACRGVGFRKDNLLYPKVNL